MNSKKEMQHVYLVGAKSLGAYGGYETFVYKLTEYHQNKENIKYHVACKANGDGCMDESKFEGVTKINDHEFELHNAHCFKIDVPQIGSAQAIYYDVAALKACCEHIKKNHIPHPIVYIMACRIGPFAGHFYREIHKLGGTVYLNPDGHEWMRAKWSAPIRKYWKISEQMMVKYCDLAICDSVNIEKYIHECYDSKGIKGSSPKTTFIAYGADLTLSKLADDDEKLVSWYKEKGLTKKGYYLVVGRFVPENSFEVMIWEFMKSKSKKDFAIITNVNDKFLNELEEKLHFKNDKRIKFVGTVYDQELLKKIRENAYAAKNKLHSVKLAKEHLENVYIIPCDIWCDRNPFHRHELYSWYMVSDLVDNESNVRVNRKMELVTVPESSGGNAMIGICYLVKENADTVAERVDELCKNQRYDGAFWEEALYNKDRMIIAARVVHSTDVVEINTYEQL